MLHIYTSTNGSDFCVRVLPCILYVIVIEEGEAVVPRFDAMHQLQQRVDLLVVQTGTMNQAGEFEVGT